MSIYPTNSIEAYNFYISPNPNPMWNSNSDIEKTVRDQFMQPHIPAQYLIGYRGYIFEVSESAIELPGIGFDYMYLDKRKRINITELGTKNSFQCIIPSDDYTYKLKVISDIVNMTTEKFTDCYI